MSTAIAVPLILSVLGATLVSAPFIDADPNATDTPYLSAAVGRFDMLKNKPRDVATDFRAEIDPNWVLLKSGILTIKPYAGGEYTSDNAFYGFGGIKFDTQYEHIYFTPTFAAGAYFKGDGKDLGSTLEFRSGAELGYQFDSKQRLGVNFSHTSNAGIGDTNPGVEVLSVYFHQPFDF